MNEKSRQENPASLVSSNMGKETSPVFAGRVETPSLEKFYGESADFFAGIIRNRLDAKSGPYSVVDVGSFRGELFDEIRRRLPGFHLTPIALDLNENALKKNHTSRKLVADAEKIPLSDHSVDVLIARYMLQWNSFERQKKILKEMERIVKKFGVIQHIGADDADPESWRKNVDDALNNQGIPEISRKNYFYSSKTELEIYMRESEISFERLQDRVIQKLSDVYISRYGLDETDSQKVRFALGNKDYCVQTSWLILPDNQK